MDLYPLPDLGGSQLRHGSEMEGGRERDRQADSFTGATNTQGDTETHFASPNIFFTDLVFLFFFGDTLTRTTSSSSVNFSSSAEHNNTGVRMTHNIIPTVVQTTLTCGGFQCEVRVRGRNTLART